MRGGEKPGVLFRDRGRGAGAGAHRGEGRLRQFAPTGLEPEGDAIEPIDDCVFSDARGRGERKRLDDGARELLVGVQHESDRCHPGGALAGRHNGRRQRDLELRRKGRHVRSHGIVEFEWVFDAFDRAQGQLRDIRGIFRPQCRIATHRFADDLTQIVADGQLREPKDLAQHDQVGGMYFLVRDGSVEPRANRLQGLARPWVPAVRIDPNLIQAVRQTGKYFVAGFVPFLRVVQVEKILERGFELFDGGNLPPRH